MKRRILLAALPAALAWRTGSAQTAGGWDAEKLEVLRGQLATHPQLRAFLMERGGSVAVAHYRADTQPATLVNIASVTKSVVALLVGIAVERGAIRSLDEPLAALFPEHAQGTNAPALARVTLRHLLTMSSGFDPRSLTYDTDYGDFVPRFYAPGLLPHALGRPLASEPGSRFYYSNIDVHLVALALARRVQMPLVSFARQELFEPLGIAGFDWPVNSEGMPNGAADMRLAPPDLLRIGRLVLDGGRWQGRQVVPQRFVQEATSRIVPTDLIQPRGRAELWGYGFLWWTASTPGDDLPAFYAAGYGGQYVYVVPALDLVVVALTEQVSRQTAARTAALIRDVALPAVAR